MLIYTNDDSQLFTTLHYCNTALAQLVPTEHYCVSTSKSVPVFIITLFIIFNTHQLLINSSIITIIICIPHYMTLTDIM
jgi:hypothetical protein